MDAYMAALVPDEDTSEEDEIRSLQALVNDGAWGLEGSVGRAMMAAIEAGVVALGTEGHRDYWGNYVPSRDEVEAGTMGSVEYVVERSPFGAVLE